MARTPDPKVAARRKKAAELEAMGMKSPQIAEKMSLEGKAVTAAGVRKWLQKERGPRKPPFKARIIELLRDGSTFEEIIDEVNCSRENVRKIEREIRHELDTRYTKLGRRLQEYLADPEKHKNDRYTRYESFQNQLVAHCNHLTNTDPANAKHVIKAATRQFLLLKDVFQAPEKVQFATCNLVQVAAANAARSRILKRPKSGLSIIRGLTRRYSSLCSACAADLARRESIILHDLKLLPESLARIKEAEELYHLMSHHGHDGDGNGLGSCAVTKVVIYYYMNQHCNAVAIADDALQRLNIPFGTPLSFRLRFNKALNLLEVPGQLESAISLIDDLMQECGIAASVPRLHLVYLAGRAAEATGNENNALHYFEDAFEYAEELQIPAAIGALEADIARILNNPTELQSRIDRLRDCNGDRLLPPPDFPLWLEPISHVLLLAESLSRTNFEKAIKILRQESGGDRFLPRNAVAAAAC